MQRIFFKNKSLSTVIVHWSGSVSGYVFQIRMLIRIKQLKTGQDPHTCSLHSIRSVYPEIVNCNAGKVFQPCEHKLSLSYPPLWINIWTGSHTLYVHYTSYLLLVFLPYRQCYGFGSVFIWPPGSGSVIICVDHSIFKQKNKKNLYFYDFLLLFEIITLKSDVNVPSKSNKQKTLKKTYFCWHLVSLWRKKQDPEPDPEP
jgi:hypothetical protein